MSFVVKEIQATPNPNATKFILDRAIAEAPLSFLKPADAQADPLAAKLFAIPGVSSLLFLGDFITINKRPEAKWIDISREARAVLQKG